MALQFGIKEVLDLVIRDFATQKPFAFIDYAQASGNEVTSEQTEIRGGRGNALLMTFDHSKTTTMTLTLPLVDLGILALLAGSDLEEATGNMIKTEKKTVQNGKVFVNKTPVGTDIAVHEVVSGYGFGEQITGVTNTGREIEVGSAYDGQEVFITYQHEIPANSKKIQLSSGRFPKTISMTGYGVVRDREDMTDKPVLVEVHQARPQSNFSFEMSSTDPTVLELTFDVLEFTDENGNKGYINYTFIDEPEGTIDTTP